VQKKAKKSKSVTGPSRLSRFRDWLTRVDPGRQRRFGGLVLWIALGALLVVGLVVGMRTLERRVLTDHYRHGRGIAALQLTHVPRWMPESLAREILADITPADPDLADRSLAQRVYDRSRANAWVRSVRQVHVRPFEDRPGGVVQVSLAYRRPAARIRHGAQYFYVDNECNRLPATQVPHWVVSFDDRHGRVARQVSYIARAEAPAAWQPAASQIHYVTIDGVATVPPATGARWDAPDLAAALRLVELVRHKSYYPQITLIDVRNHAARITRNEPELRMYAQIGRGRPTDIRFGRFPAPGGGDYVVSPARKVSYLDEYAADHGGRVAGINSYLDLRFDQLHVSIH